MMPGGGATDSSTSRPKAAPDTQLPARPTECSGHPRPHSGSSQHRSKSTRLLPVPKRVKPGCFAGLRWANWSRSKGWGSPLAPRSQDKSISNEGETEESKRGWPPPRLSFDTRHFPLDAVPDLDLGQRREGTATTPPWGAG